eukprot:TRINITY_DN50175_c0_g1_i1.p1 TRINITY_DN50175_c0_g1~~TRINITY_DN50175_c0_g1_i1.p1  ORF type:complete len:362 (-),score=55.32 TRINITY_DN50175_c0_g1_i1:72-1085(-)
MAKRSEFSVNHLQGATCCVAGASGGICDAPVSNKTAAGDPDSLLRNYRLRRQLGLLPAASAAPNRARNDACPTGTLDLEESAHALRWVRQTWRPRASPHHSQRNGCIGGTRNLDGNDGDAARRDAAAAQVIAEVAELQQKMERSYSELNAERRNHNALCEGLRRQGDSVAAITAETAKLQAQLVEIRQEIQRRSATSSQLRAQLGLQRQNHASGLTQAAVLASAVNRLCGRGDTVFQNDDMAVEVAETAVPSAHEELIMLRAQIKGLVAENEALEQHLAQTSMSASAAAVVPTSGTMLPAKGVVDSPVSADLRQHPSVDGTFARLGDGSIINSTVPS